MTTLSQNSSLFSSEEKRDSIKGKILFIFESGRNTTINELAAELNVKLATITGRISELNDAGMIKDIGLNVTQSDGSIQTVYGYVNDPKEQQLISFERNRDKIIKALKVLKSNSKHLTNFINKAVEVEFIKLNK